MEKKYRVKLSAEEREELKAMVSKGRSQRTSRPMPASCCWATRRKREGL